MERIRPEHRAAGTVLFLLYLAVLSYFLFFAEAFGRDPAEEYHYNLVLFKEIRRFWTCREQLGTAAFVLNVFGNVIAFLPFGFFFPIVTGKRHSFFLMLLHGFLFSGVIELLQLVTKLGSFDVDDIVLNTAGAVLGYLIFRLSFRRIGRV